MEVQRWSGERNWEEVNFQTTPGTHNIKWIYIKDTTVSLGNDAAFIDEIKID